MHCGLEDALRIVLRGEVHMPQQLSGEASGSGCGVLVHRHHTIARGSSGFGVQRENVKTVDWE